MNMPDNVEQSSQFSTDPSGFSDAASVASGHEDASSDTYFGEPLKNHRVADSSGFTSATSTSSPASYAGRTKARVSKTKSRVDKSKNKNKTLTRTDANRREHVTVEMPRLWKRGEDLLLLLLMMNTNNNNNNDNTNLRPQEC